MTELPVPSSIQATGRVHIADEVIAVIAGTAALEVDGVVGMAGNITGEIIQAFGVRNLSKGVKVTVRDNDVSLDMNLFVDFGKKIQQVAQNVQDKVKTAVETMTGLTANQINVHVVGIHSRKVSAANVQTKKQ